MPQVVTPGASSLALRHMAAPASPLRAAVIDADRAFVSTVARRLSALGCEHWVSERGLSVGALTRMRLHVLLLDPAAAGGEDYLQRVCEALPGLGLVVCTAPTSVAERVRGLRLGADDWLTKPCHPEEAVARLEAVARRRRRHEQRHSDAVRYGELEIRPERRQVSAANRQAELTAREFEVLALLVQSGAVLEREVIYERIWGYAMARGDRSVDVVIRKLRRKLASISPGWTYVHTHFGVGYRFEARRQGDTASGETASGETASPAPASAESS